MSATTLFLSQIMGITLLVIGLGFFLNRSVYVKWIKRMEKDGSVATTAAIGEFAVGLAIVLSHNVWNTAPEILVSIMGWAMVLEGGLLLLATDWYIDNAAGLIKNENLLNLCVLVILAGGGYLTYAGFFM